MQHKKHTSQNPQVKATLKATPKATPNLSETPKFYSSKVSVDRVDT
jgi:hypothetical protein